MASRILSALADDGLDVLTSGPPPAHAYTVEYLIERQKIIDTVNSICLYAELGQWDVVRSGFHDLVRLDYSSMTLAMTGEAGGAVEKTADEVVRMWQESLPGFDLLVHLMTNHIVHVNESRSFCLCQVRATHFIGKDAWTLLGRYEWELRKSPDEAWRVSGLTFHYGAQSGIESVRTRAAEIMARRAKR